jgi:hypothetical protein
MAAILIFRDFDVPILWSTAIGVALWSWVLLLLWSTDVPAGGSEKAEGKRRRQHHSAHTAGR